MNYRRSVVILGCGLVVVGGIAGGWGWVVVWLGLDWLALAVAHRRGAHGLLGKRPDGTLPWWSWVVFLPLHVQTRAIWWLVRATHPDPPYSVVTDRLILGRRLLSAEVDFECENYVDLTAEFSEPTAIRRAPAYRCFPVLDFGALSPEALDAALQGLRPGRTFVHCAQGHGRAAVFTLAVLLRSGAVRTVEDGLALLRVARPGVRLNHEQQECIRVFAERTARAGGDDRPGTSRGHGNDPADR